MKTLKVLTAIILVNMVIYGTVGLIFSTLNPLHWNMLAAIFVWVALCISSVLFWGISDNR